MSTTGNSAQQLLAHRGWRWRNSTWMLIPFFTCGAGTGATFIVLGARAHRRDWWGPGIAYAVLAVLAFALNVLAATDSVLETVTSLVFVGVWAIGLAHGFLINHAWLRWRSEDEAASLHPHRIPPGSEQGPPPPRGLPEPSSPWTQGGSPPAARWAAGAGRAASSPWAQDARTGGPPPTVQPAPFARSVDVNTAGIGELASLPGFDYERAGRVVTARGQQDGFGTMEDFHRAARLAPHEIVGIRDHVHCSIPRR